jgi:hypothetical protein
MSTKTANTKAYFWTTYFTIQQHSTSFFKSQVGPYSAEILYTHFSFLKLYLQPIRGCMVYQTVYRQITPTINDKIFNMRMRFKGGGKLA